MIYLRYCFTILFIIVFNIAQSQETDTGFGEDLILEDISGFDKDFFEHIQDSIANTRPDLMVIGLKSLYRNFVDSANFYQQNKNSVIYFKKGVYIIKPQKLPGNSLYFKIQHPDYHDIDTSIKLTESTKNNLIFSLKPKFKITIRARIYSGNVPIEDVNVWVVHNTDTFKLKTRPCFYDSDDYWNCLYHGMFKQDINAVNPNDSIYIFLSKNGYQSKKVAFKFDEYNGQILPISLAYDEFLPKLYRHNIALKFTFPIFSDSDWYAGFSYLYTLKLKQFNRLSIGAEGSLLIKNHQETFETFAGAEKAEVDTSYLIGFAGPTVVVWITNPVLRKYSLYTGASYTYMFTASDFVVQPFIGGRFYIDLNKAISFDVRYLNYNLDIVQYEFNPYGMAQRTVVNKAFNNKILVSLGLHIGF